jgi:hypothetical protein
MKDSLDPSSSRLDATERHRVLHRGQLINGRIATEFFPPPTVDHDRP